MFMSEVALYFRERAANEANRRKKNDEKEESQQELNQRAPIDVINVSHVHESIIEISTGCHRDVRFFRKRYGR